VIQDRKRLDGVGERNRVEFRINNQLYEVYNFEANINDAKTRRVRPSSAMEAETAAWQILNSPSLPPESNVEIRFDDAGRVIKVILLNNRGQIMDEQPGCCVVA
jgi:hypothetical protein